MFTGIVTDIGEVVAVENRADTRFEIACSYARQSIDIGASISCSGACLTVVETRDGEGAGCVFAVDVSAETLSKTNLGNWRTGTRINLERSLKLGDELGGHVVSGHVDGLAEIVSITPEGDSRRFVFAVTNEIARYIAPKGSVALDGTSFTVNEVDGNRFGINIIPHTQNVTTWGAAKVGDKVNIEIDMLARYVARLTQFPATGKE